MSFGQSRNPQQQAFTGPQSDVQPQAGYSAYGAQTGYMPPAASGAANGPQAGWPAGGYPGAGTQPQWAGQTAGAAPGGTSGAYGAYPQGTASYPGGTAQGAVSGNSAYGGMPGYPGGRTAAGPTGGYGAAYGMPGGIQPSVPYQQTAYGAPGAQNGSYIPQTPYSQGYASPGYTNPMTGAAPGYEGYGQMGRTQQPRTGQPDPRAGIPLNGGGYVPPAVPVRQGPFVFSDAMLILLSAVLIVLFAVGLTTVPALLWVFLAGAAASTVFFWIRPVIATNKRLCFTVIMCALAVIAVLRVTNVIGGQPGTAGDSGTTPPSTQTSAAEGNAASAVQTPVSQPSEVTPIPAEAASDAQSASTEDNASARVESFFYYWMVNKTDDMLALCAPSWQRSAKNPQADLFGLIANRTPLDCVVEKTSGTPDDTSRTVTVSTTIDRNNGKDPVKYRLGILVVREDGEWYVDPRSIKSYEKDETQDPASQPTPTPTQVPPASPGTMLYYNPDGGSKYHLDQNCKSTHAKYLPMKGHFTYAEINDEKYAKLEPCNVCAAPLRP